MATKYIPDELIAEIVNNGDDVQSFIREAIEEKIERTKAKEWTMIFICEGCDFEEDYDEDIDEVIVCPECGENMYGYEEW